MARDIFKNELKLKMERSRFHFQRHSYPINFVVFENESILGQFNSDSYQIALNKKLMYLSKDVVIKNILRHEIAHLITFIKYGQACNAHGNEYKKICQTYDWGKEVSNAKVNLELENQKFEGNLDCERLISKIKKLLALAESSNINESQIATAKANQLLLKHNLNKINLLKSSKEEISTYVIKVLHSKRSSGKLKAIYEILQLFYVQPVISHSKIGVCLELIGNKENILIAQYVANFLSHELERLWKNAKKENKLSGISEKNSFFYGVSQGQKEKISLLNKDLNINEKALEKVHQSLSLHVSRVYPRLSYSKSSAQTCTKSMELGKIAGKNMSINPAVKSKSSTLLLN